MTMIDKIITDVLDQIPVWCFPNTVRSPGLLFYSCLVNHD